MFVIFYRNTSWKSSYEVLFLAPLCSMTCNHLTLTFSLFFSVPKRQVGLADDFLRLGFLPPHTELAPVEEALRAVFEASRAKAEAKLQGGGSGGDDSVASSRMDFRGAVAELSEVYES